MRKLPELFLNLLYILSLKNLLIDVNHKKISEYVEWDIPIFEWSAVEKRPGKELKIKYPKHYWPEDPYTAEAIQGVRPKKKT